MPKLSLAKYSIAFSRSWPHLCSTSCSTDSFVLGKRRARVSTEVCDTLLSLALSGLLNIGLLYLRTLSLITCGAELQRGEDKRSFNPMFETNGEPWNQEGVVEEKLVSWPSAGNSKQKYPAANSVIHCTY